MPAIPNHPQKLADTDHPIHELIAERWSPYGFSDKQVDKSDLLSIFEAARWSSSSYNEQPWRYIVALKQEGENYQELLECLTEKNQQWAKNAPVLALSLVRRTFTKTGEPNRVAVHDAGLASARLVFEANARGLCVHQMAGVDADCARGLYHVPDEYDVVAGIAIGYAADPDDLSPPIAAKDTAPRERKPLSELIFGGDFGKTAPWVA